MTIGLDLGDRNSRYCVVDEAGHIQGEQPVRTTAKGLQELFSAMPRSRVALETGTHSPWISRLLKELGHEVIVANARKVRLIGESRKKDDRLDAQTLARLARIDPELLSPVKHRSAQAQADLMMIRARAGLVRVRPGLVNTARGLAKSYGERSRSCNVRNMNPEKAESLSPELPAVRSGLRGGRAPDTQRDRSRNPFAARRCRFPTDPQRAERSVRSVVAPELAKLEQQREHLRYEKEEGMINFLRDTGALRSGLSHRTARDIFWMLTGGDVYRMVVRERGWSPQKYQNWLADTLVRSLLRKPESGTKSGRET